MIALILSLGRQLCAGDVIRESCPACHLVGRQQTAGRRVVMEKHRSVRSMSRVSFSRFSSGGCVPWTLLSAGHQQLRSARCLGWRLPYCHEWNQSTGVPERSELWPNFELSQLKNVGTNIDVMLLRGLLEAKGGSRGIRKALLRLLPHLWSDPVDTRLEVHLLPSRGPGHGATNPTEGTTLKSSSPSGGSGTRAGGEDSNGPEVMDKQGAEIWAVVAHTREGMEAVDLRDGTALGAVALPATAGGAGVYADLNGDGLVDHIQVNDTVLRVRCAACRG